jgi:hypothetical protein
MVDTRSSSDLGPLAPGLGTGSAAGGAGDALVAFDGARDGASASASSDRADAAAAAALADASAADGTFAIEEGAADGADDDEPAVNQ